VIGTGSFNPPTSPLEPGTGQGEPFATYVYGTQIADVIVDDETGEVEVVRVCAAHDSGTAVNPPLIEGQIEGGVAMGIGMALQEEMLFDGDGRIVNPNLTNYIIPTAMDVPPIEVDIVESYDPIGPFGAKGVGEPALVPTLAAITNAIYDAVGVRITELPATSEKVLAALRRREADPAGG
jgi:CO/xanthine dehydrogenase Mo-binding subunit